LKKIIIIGAGIGGLAAANLFARDGYEVHVYEKNDQLGGRAGRFEKDGFTFDTGPSWYLMPEVFEHYYQQFQTTAQKELDLIKLTPAYKVYSGKKQLTITGDLEVDAKTFESLEPGSGEKLKWYIGESTKTYRLSLKHFLYSNFDSPRDLAKAEILKHGAAMLKLATTPIHSYVKKYFTNPQLQQVLEYPTVFLGSSPFSAPALYSLMSALDFDEGVFYPRGTMYAVVESLVRIGTPLGVHYHLNATVKAIVTKAGVAVGIKLSDGAIEKAAIVISNADLHFTETQLLKPAEQSYPAAYWNKREPSPSALLMYIGIDGKVPEFEHHTLLFTENWKENFNLIFKDKRIPTPASLYISKTSQSDATAPKGKENIFVLVPLPAGISLTKEESEALADTYLEQIKETTGVDIASRTITRTLFGPDDFANKYNAWESTMLGPSHKLLQSAFFRTPNKSKKVTNLYYVGASTVPGVGVPMCLIGAELVHKRIVKEGAH
jgi:phytoene desaturase